MKMKTTLRCLNKNLSISIMVASLLTLNMPSAWAQDEMAMPEMQHASHTNTEAEIDMDFSDMDIHDDEQPMAHSEMNMNMGSMQGGSAPADARDPHANSGGFSINDSSDIQRLVLADEYNFSSLLVNRLESVNGSDNSSSVYDIQAWYGRDYDRLVLKAEGDADAGKLQESSTELLWSHAIATFWDTQLGIRYDGGEEPDRSWLALGMQGLAPYWFEVDATFYIGENSMTAFTLEAEYELLLTQKLILQPRIEADFYGKKDLELERGTGLSDLTAGVRLRYEIKRELAPYVGIEWSGKYGGTANFASANGQSKSDTAIVAGLRFWF